MSTQKRIIKIDIHSYWHIGTGEGSGPSADAIVATSPNKLPIWPGKSLKGVFRDAFYQATALESLKDHSYDDLLWLFGPNVELTSPEEGSDNARDSFQNKKGAFKFSDGRLDIGEKYLALEEWAGSKEGKEYTPFFYKEVSNVALNEDGTAKKGALRSIQLTKPVSLFAEVEFSTEDENQNAQKAFQLLEETFPLIRLMGASRTRGLGRISVSYQQ